MSVRLAFPSLAIGSALLLCAALAFMGDPSAQAPEGPDGAAARDASGRAPRLLVLLSVDQMRADYVDRYRHQWTGGLKRLLERGAWFRHAAYPYMNTVTCPGHATISTGTLPATHGMVLNEWWDRAAGRKVTCTEDAAVRNLGARGPLNGGDSPGRLLVTTLSDELRAQRRPPPRVVSLSLKARSAIMLAGHRADLVLWHGGTEGWITSTAYTHKRDEEMDRFIAEHPIEADFEKTWDRTLPARDYLFDDAGEGERKEGWGAIFPHVLGSGGKPNAARLYELWEASPFSDEYLGALAARAIERFDLGRAGHTDYLAVSFSALDVVGHAYGPRSHEVQDLLVRLDRTIGRFLDLLDRRVGAENYVVALTADHGVAPIPEQMNAIGVDAGRIPVSMEDPGELNARIVRHVEGGKLAALVYTDLYLAPGVYDRLRAKPGALDDVVGYLERTRGVGRVLRRDDIVANRLPAGEPLARAVALGFNRERSGDLLLIPRPYWIISTSATTHGTGYDYDARVPIMLLGRGVRAGEYLQPASPADVAPTLAFIAGVTLPRTDGRVLGEALTRAGEAKP